MQVTLNPSGDAHAAPDLGRPCAIVARVMPCRAIQCGDGKRASEGHDRSLHRRIVDQYWLAGEGRDGCRLDDSAVLFEIRQPGLHHLDHGEDIGAESPLHIVGLNIRYVVLRILHGGRAISFRAPVW
jgi:hypothetical protein